MKDGLLIDLLRDLASKTDATPEEWQAVENAVLVRMGLRSGSSDAPCAPEPPALVLDTTDLASWLTGKDLAVLLGVLPATLRVWKHRGKLPPPDEVIGDRPAWSRGTVRQWVAELSELAS